MQRKFLETIGVSSSEDLHEGSAMGLEARAVGKKAVGEPSHVAALGFEPGSCVSVSTCTCRRAHRRGVGAGCRGKTDGRGV